MTKNDGLDADVVLIEKDPTVRRLSRLILEAAGCRVVEADDRKRALAFIDDGGASIDLLVADVQTCDPCGTDLAGHARATRPHLKVLYTATPGGRRQETPILRDGERCLAKPYGGRDLTAAVRSLLSSDRESSGTQAEPVAHRAIR